MKKSLLSICFILAGIFTTFAQTGTVIGTQIRIAEKPNGEFTDWTTDWINLADSDKPTLEITADTHDESGTTYSVYYIKFTFEGEVSEGTYVYDAEKSGEIRKAWNKKVVNCYVDPDGEYIYVEDTSLKALAENPNSWAKHPNSAIQFINKDMNIAFK